MRQLVLIWFLYTIVIIDPYKGLCTDCIIAYHYDLNIETSIKTYGPTKNDNKEKEEEKEPEWTFCHFCFPPQWVPKFLD